MREPQLQGMHPAHSRHLMHDIREQRICKSKAVGCCGPCLVYGKAVNLYFVYKSWVSSLHYGFFTQGHHRYTHSSVHSLLLPYASILGRFFHTEYLHSISFASL